jgi:endoglucanase
MAGDDPGAHIPVISDVDYGRRITAYFEKKGVSWTAWCFDPDWPPQLISDWDYTPTTQGAFFRDYMLGKQ